jgi:hypothetical protein
VHRRLDPPAGRPAPAGKAPFGTKLKILDHDRNPMPTGEVDRVFVGNDMLFEADGVQNPRRRS